MQAFCADPRLYGLADSNKQHMEERAQRFNRLQPLARNPLVHFADECQILCTLMLTQARSRREK